MFWSDWVTGNKGIALVLCLSLSTGKCFLDLLVPEDVVIDNNFSGRLSCEDACVEKIGQAPEQATIDETARDIGILSSRFH